MSSKITMKDVMTANCQISNEAMLTSNHCAALARELNKIMAAPIVERQQHEWDINEHGTATVCSICGIRSSDVPPELQATIAQQAAEIERLSRESERVNKSWHGMKRDLDNAKAEIERLKGEPIAWSYCPECGCEELHYEEGEHKQCANCHQEWFSSIDYSEVVRGNLAKLKTSQPAPVSVDERAEFVAWVRHEWPQAPLSNVRDLLPKNDPRYGEYCDETLQRAWVGWQARACLDKVKELNQ